MESQESVLGLEIYWQILQRRWLLGLASLISVFTLSVLTLSVIKQPVYEAQGKLLFQRTNKVSAFTGLGTELGTLEPVVQDRNNPLNTEAEIIRSVPVVQKTIAKIGLKGKQDEPLKYRDFIKQLNVQEIKGSDVLQISYRDASPKTAANVVNTLMQLYLEQNISFHRAEVGVARKFIEKQLPTAELVVRQAEIKLRQFREKNQVIALQTEANQGVQRIADLQRQIGDIQSRIADINAQAQVISNQLQMNAPQALTVTSLSQSRGVQDILTQIQQLESQIATRSSILQDNHPEMIRLRNNFTNLQGILQKRINQVAQTTVPQNQTLQSGELQQQLAARLVELESIRQSLTSQLSTLSKLESNHRQRLSILPKLEQQQRELERQVQAAQSTYSLLLQKLQESRIAENQNLGNARNISPALIPEQPASSAVISYLSAVLLGILAALASIYLVEAIDKSIKSVEEARELLELTLLGVIPAFNKEQKLTFGSEEPDSYCQRLVVNYAPRSAISEAYRMLRANLTFVSADKELKVILVTSSVPKEGKSTVSANLALVMAQIGRKVLLIDADLHRPVQHKIWELANNQGLSNIIVGQANIETTVTKVSDNLDVLTAGVVPPSPASLLDSKRMAELIQHFSSNYDFAIIDAPALTVAADAVTLGQMADGILFVVRPGVVDSVNASVARQLLEQSGQNVLGQVVNAVITQNEPHSQYCSVRGK
ncbi:MAG: polysaccharide biosynthesis tyrosine autokinase [Nostocaceae cyanobacterium]|nr:polysaccharide biosynthesis tyrosine autokinase [Nostocaceae cyanobacterium]